MAIITCATVVLWLSCSALIAKEFEPLNGPFNETSVIGTFVGYDPNQDRLLIHNTHRANERFVPASTFKIVNALVGLSIGTVKNVDEVLPYGGQPQPFPNWEKNMSLREAMPISNVPIYQELARRIGLDEMKSAVQKLDYGNEKVGDVVDRFWLDGPLLISAVEQVDFLRRMLDGKLDLPAGVIDSVKAITLLESGPGYNLHGKTGWGPIQDVGWFVGWVEKDGRHYPFALNMTITDAEQLPMRLKLAKECLQKLGMLPVSHNQ